MELVTGHGASEHITAAQVSRFIQGITVMDDTTVYRLNVGNDCSLVIGGLDVLINTGEMVLHGYHTTFEDSYQVTLDPTLNAAYSRIDKLCLIVSEDLTTGIQSAYIQVVQGTESANPSAPATPSTPSSLTEMYLGVGVIATVTVSDSIIASYVDNTSLYAGSFVTKTEYDNDLAQTRQMIAPIEATNVVSKVGGYVKDDRLIYNGVLYKVDASTISEGTTLVPGGNISLSPDVEAQISSLKSSLDNEKIVASLPTTGYSKADYGSFKKGGIQYVKMKVTFPNNTSNYYDLINLPANAHPKYGSIFPVTVGRGNKVYATVGLIELTNYRIQVFITDEIAALGSVDLSVYVDVSYEIA